MNKSISIKYAIPAALAAMLMAGTAHATEETQVPATESTQSREAVRADLRNWKEAGLDKLSHGEQTADISSAEYRTAERHYAELNRNGALASASR
ncbi:DUF4148 domain-containing protein [Bordetella sp. BOR01]|uniref:DUF4148 domain-containing protein n=1 Tax=Bordetella sp. BOR01 TaxID=2854779 RepID=UPI001C488099|nr:DUF4148 domain-containing protein [Bordetella sp. BOR01]MBV7484876.1 DUF4148 domain-containing protein [Bordetella sp. BOR01]